MTRLIVAFFLCLTTNVALAATEIWPSLYDVSGVAANDVLNVRAEPNARAEIVGTLAYDAANIEVIELNFNGWGRVNIGERSGWVSMAFLEGSPRLSGSFPPISSCYGAEPFWALDISEGSMTFSLFGESGPAIPYTETADIMNLTRFGFGAEGLTGIIRHELCSDGMSDRTFGLSVDVLYKGSNGWQQFSGCCSIAP